MAAPGNQEPNDFAGISDRLRSERAQMSPLELDQLKRTLMARPRQSRSRLIAWTGSARWVTIGAVLAVVAAATGGTIATVNGNRGGGVFGGAAQNASCAQYAQNISFRLHFASGTSGSFSSTNNWSQTSNLPGQTCSGTVSWPQKQTMEGNLTLPPGAVVQLGYDFDVPGNNSTFNVTVSNFTFTFTWTCATKGVSPTPPTNSYTLPTATYAVSGSSWVPTGDQSTDWQGSFTVPNVCNGGNVSLSQGATATANVNVT